MNSILSIVNIISNKTLNTYDKLLQILDTLDVAVVFINQNRRIIKYNTSFVKLSGYDEKDLKGMDTLELIPDRYKNVALSKFITKSEKPYEIKGRKRNGEIITVLIQGKNINIDGEEIRAVILNDITSQRNLENENSLLKTAIEELNESIVITDVDGNIMFVNKFFEKITGYSKKEAIGQNPRILKSGYHSEIFYRKMWDTILSGETWVGEIFNKKKNGDFFWERAVITPFTDGTGEILFFIAGKQDITKEKEIIELLQRSETRYKKLIENAPIAILTFKLNGEIEIVNKKMLQLLGSPSADETKKINVMTFPLLVKSGITKKFKESIEEKKTIVFEEEYVSKWGKPVYFRGHITPIVNDRGNVDSVVVLTEDVSLQKQYERAILEAKEKAERNDKLKNFFLANISHELRTPLNAIIGFSDLLRNDSLLTSDQLESVNLIYSSGRHLLRLIEDLMSISKIEANEIELIYEKVRLKDFISSVLKYYEEDAISNISSSNVNFVVTRNKEIDEMEIYVDQDRLREVIQNLLNNAFKFTHEGSVTFTYKLASNNQLEFTVKDTGIGIPKEKHNTVFEKFRQVQEDYTRRYEGSGLGLYIAKRLVEMMGGEINFESEMGRGTTFWVRVPLKQYQQKEFATINSAEDEKQKMLLDDVKILIAEDDPTNVLLLRQYFECNGIDCKIVNTGKQVVEEIEKNPVYDVILMDIRMPEMDGIEATKIIKKKFPDIKIIMQTAHAYEKDMEVVKKVGGDGYITKPFRKSDIINEIKRVLSLD